METYNIAVIGAGMMGAEIGFCFALHGAKVLLKDINLDLSEAGKSRVQGILEKWGKKEKIGPGEKDKVLERIIPCENYSGFDAMDLVVEAALENHEIKAQVFKEMDEICKHECIFASNTSSIPISQLASATLRPDRFIGMHFFSPASVMKLVEVIPGLDTSKDTIDKVMHITRGIEKEPIQAPDRAGFIVNRLLFAFYNEAWRMVEENAATPEDIDKAVKLGLGHPVGIFQMNDLAGLDAALSISNILYDEYGERFRAAPVVKRKVSAHHIGRKVNKGWFDYNK